jgi:hypothetical protein
MFWLGGLGVLGGLRQTEAALNPTSLDGRKLST